MWRQEARNASFRGLPYPPFTAPHRLTGRLFPFRDNFCIASPCRPDGTEASHTPDQSAHPRGLPCNGVPRRRLPRLFCGSALLHIVGIDSHPFLGKRPVPGCAETGGVMHGVFGCVLSVRFVSLCRPCPSLPCPGCASVLIILISAPLVVTAIDARHDKGLSGHQHIMDTATVGTLCQDINLLQIMPFNGTKRLMPVPFPLCVRLGAASVGTSGFGSAELRPVGMFDV